jgi:hypothetical protein
MRDIISRVLDQVLEEPVRTEQVGLGSGEGEVGFDMSTDLFDFDAFGEFDVLGEVDWMKAPWAGMP